MPYRPSHLRLISKETRSPEPLTAIKAHQEARIRHITQALVLAGISGLDEQSKALGLGRSTAWNILKANHKSTGISPAIIDRMLASPTLPQPVRAIIILYVEEKAAGLYGHSRAQRRRFVKGLASKLAARRRRGQVAPLWPDIDIEKFMSTAEPQRHPQRRYEFVVSRTRKALNVT